MADDDEWAPSECPDEIATAEVDQVKAKSKEKSKKDKVWPVQAVKSESVVNRAAVHDGMKSTSRPVAPAAGAPLLRRVPPIQIHMLFGARTVASKL